MNEIDYQTQRNRYFWYSVIGLMVIPLLIGALVSLAHLPIVFDWLPFMPSVHTAYLAVINSLHVVLEAFGQVAMMQLLIWWLWRPIGQTRWEPAVMLLVALMLGQSGQIFGYWVGAWIGGQNYSGFDLKTLLMTAALTPIGMLWTISILWLWLLVASFVIPYRLVDLSDATIANQYRSGRRWSISELMILTTLIAAMIVGYQGYQRLTRWWFASAQVIDVSVWFTLLRITLTGVTGVLVLWSAARYRVGGSMWISYLTLVLVASWRAGQSFAFTRVIGTSSFNSLLPQMTLQAAIMIAIMFGLHLLIFYRWQHAGYQLRIQTANATHC